MSDLLSGTNGLVFAVGFEDTAIGRHPRGGDSVLDEYELTGHLRQWREDLDRAAATGASALRYGFPWYRVNPAPGVFDWSWTDQVVDYLTGTLGMTVIVDLVHYGTPTWLSGSFTDVRFSEALAAYAGAAAARYRGAVAAYTPVNEPLVTASFCGMRAVWPPYLSGDDGWAAVLTSVIAGVQEAMRAIHAADAQARIVHVEAVQLYLTHDPALDAEVRQWRLRSAMPIRLLFGEVGPADEEWAWLARHGVAATRLHALREQGARPDVLGLNYYPELSCRELVRLDERIAHVVSDGGLDGIVGELRRCHAVYGMPLMVTETAVEGATDKQCAWLDTLAAGLRHLRAEALPIVGITWWPLIDFVDWSWASGGAVVEEFYRRDAPGEPPHPVIPPAMSGESIAPFLRRMGIYRLDGTSPDDLMRSPTALLDRFRAHASSAATAPVHTMEQP